MIKCNYSGLTSFRNAIAAASSGELMAQCARQVAEKLIECAQGKTPVDTGRLSSGYTISGIAGGGGGSVRVEVKNDVEYAIYVEMGHRTPSHTGWVPGRYMLTLAADEVQAAVPEILEAKIMEFLKGCLSGG